jgi:uncharacterized protein
VENYDLRYGDDRYAVANAPASVRASFLKGTYAHVAGAILAFVAIEAALFGTGLAEPVLRGLFSDRLAGLFVIVGVLVGSYVASYFALSHHPKPVQYAGLGLYVLIEAVIFLPVLYRAETRFPGQHLALQAGIVTLLAVAALTAAVWTSGVNFSFLGPVVWVGFLVALGVVVCAMIFGFHLGLVFVAAMIVLASLSVVYQTSNVLHEYGPGQEVGAALGLFASIATLFFYILQLFMSNRD